MQWPILLWLPVRLLQSLIFEYIQFFIQKWLQWFRWEAERQKKLHTEFYMELMNTVKIQIEEGTAQESMATRALSKQAQFGMNEEQTAYALASPYAAGVGTVSSKHCMILFRLLTLTLSLKTTTAADILLSK